MPSDRALVEQMLRDPANQDSIRRYFTALTPEEGRYVDSRHQLYALGTPVSEYFERNGGGVPHGVAIVDDFPREAYFAVYISAADLEPHAPNLTAISLRIRVLPITLPPEQLERARQRVQDGRAQLEREGIHIYAWGNDASRSTATVSLISARPDAAAIVESRLGPHVRAEVTGTRLSYRACVSPDAYWTARHGRSLRIAWESGVVKAVRVSARESANTVRGAHHRTRINPSASADRDLQALDSQAAGPLGDRKVIDAETGRRLHLLGKRDPLRRPTRRRAR